MGYYYDQIVDNRFVVLTGVDVVPCVHDTSSGIANGGTGDLRMIKYESKLHVPNGSGEIERVFWIIWILRSTILTITPSIPKYLTPLTF